MRTQRFVEFSIELPRLALLGGSPSTGPSELACLAEPIAERRVPIRLHAPNGSGMVTELLGLAFQVDSLPIGDQLVLFCRLPVVRDWVVLLGLRRSLLLYRSRR